MSAEQEIVLVSHPSGLPSASDFKLQSMATPPTSATPGHILLRLKIISVDPYQRRPLRTTPIGQPMDGYAIAEVVDSQHEAFSKGDLVYGVAAWRTLQLHHGRGTHGTPLLRKLRPSPNLPLTAYIGVLGLPGWTAYFGLLDHEVGRFQPGQTVVVSGAAGAVGSLVGQLARIKGAKKVIGIAGGPDKCRLMVDKYGFDECIDYKAVTTAEAMQTAIQAAAGAGGVDLYFDNTSGFISEAAIRCLRRFGRVALCGAISGYNADPKENLIHNFMSAQLHHASLGLCIGRVALTRDSLNLMNALLLRCRAGVS